MSKRLEKFMEIKKILEDTKVVLQPIKDIGDTIIEKSYNRSSFEGGMSGAIDEINDALEEMSRQTIGFLDSEIEQETKGDSEEVE